MHFSRIFSGVVLVLFWESSNESHIGKRKLTKDPSMVIFPKRPQARHLDKETLVPFTESGNCMHHLCSNIANYPINYIKSEIYKKTEFHQFFGSVIQPYNLPRVMGKSPKSGGFEDRNLCETVQFTYYPEIAVNKNNKRMLIVNIDKFRQAVSFETCVPKARCFLEDHKPLGYETSCKQQYNLIRLVSMNEDGNFTLDSFPVPSNCVCTYRRTVLDFDLK